MGITHDWFIEIEDGVGVGAGCKTDGSAHYASAISLVIASSSSGRQLCLRCQCIRCRPGDRSRVGKRAPASICRQTDWRTCRSCPVTSMPSWRSTSPSRPGKDRQPSTPVTIASLRRVMLGFATTCSLPALSPCSSRPSSLSGKRTTMMRQLWAPVDRPSRPFRINHCVVHIINQD